MLTTLNASLKNWKSTSISTKSPSNSNWLDEAEDIPVSGTSKLSFNSFLFNKNCNLLILSDDWKITLFTKLSNVFFEIFNVLLYIGFKKGEISVKFSFIKFVNITVSL
ncbi:hypothetical protein NW739_03100 [Mycoplasmopsis felis]|nr:hypothetical protein [Mycoplasmopsis felis]MCU9934145.1 hypothetical protein [Mycoplasmopsis felis]MCU9939734.1 hypothetical protein [Mycoplasmopsis felis]